MKAGRLLLGVVAVGVITVVGWQILYEGSADAPSGPAAGGVVTTEGNYREAESVSTAALASLPLPPGTTELKGEPEDWDEGTTVLGPSDPSLTRTAWFATSQPASQVAVFYTENAPAWMRHESGVAPVSEHEGRYSTDWFSVRPNDPAYAGPSLHVTFTRIGDRTVMRAATFMAARYALTPEHRVLGAVDEVWIDRVRTDEDEMRGVRLPRVVLERATTGLEIDRLVATFNDLVGGITEWGFISGPATGDPPPSDTVTFVLDDGTRLVAEHHLAGFDQVHVSVDGRALDGSDPGREWDELVDQIAVTSDTGTPTADRG